MRRSLLAGTIAGLMLGTSAIAQSPNDQQRTNAPAATQSQSPKAGTSTATPSAQNSQTAKPAAEQSPTNATADSQRPQAQSNQPAAPSQARTDSNSANTSSQQSGSSSQPAQAQTNTAPPANNQSTSRQPSSGPANATNSGSAQPSTNTAAQPSNTQTNTAQSRTNVNVSANLTESQRTRVSQSISRLNARPVTNVNFSLSVGTVVPRDVHFQSLPAEVVEVMPQYRGYNFVVVREDIVIIEPSSNKIVDVLPRGGQSTAAAPAPRKATFSDSEREVVRKHARSSRTEPRARTEQRTTGSSTSTRVRVGDRLPDSVEIRSFPDEVYRESPRLREYRYIERDDRTYIIEPGERRIIEEIE